jgi:predicted transcriptional regulator
MQQQWVTVSEASRLLDVTERTIQRYIKENKYPSQLKNGRRYILLDLSEDLINGLKDSGNVVTEKEDITTDLMKDKLIDKMESEIEYLREELSKTREELDQSRQRSDTIILQLTRQFEQQTMLLEDMRNKSSFWQRLKMGLVRFATPSATEQNVTEQRS